MECQHPRGSPKGEDLIQQDVNTLDGVQRGREMTQQDVNSKNRPRHIRRQFHKNNTDINKSGMLPQS